MMNCRACGSTHSMHFWTTWLPFWSLTHFRTWPSSSRTISTCCSPPTLSNAFWITLQPYICNANGNTCPRTYLTHGTTSRCHIRTFKYSNHLEIIKYTATTTTYLLRQCRFLFGRAELEELLNDIVAKHIGHQAVSGSQYLWEHQLLLGRGSPLQFLLYESRAVLVLGKLDNMVGEVS